MIGASMNASNWQLNLSDVYRANIIVRVHEPWVAGQDAVTHMHRATIADGWMSVVEWNSPNDHRSFITLDGEEWLELRLVYGTHSEAERRGIITVAELHLDAIEG